MEIRDYSQVDYCFILPQELRNQLAKPYGILFTNNAELLHFLKSRKNSRIITVGDVVTKTVLDLNLTPFLSLVDGKTRRKFNIEKRAVMERVKNEAGLIRLSTISKIKELLEIDSDASKIVYVEGEEDLLVIPIIIYGKDGDIILYGQPYAGAVVLIIDDLIRRRVMEIFTKFRIVKCE
ncbi:MAG: DUF359 domain-containing protein [Sulfolobaceae archaeon]